MSTDRNLWTIFYFKPGAPTEQRRIVQLVTGRAERFMEICNRLGVSAVGTRAGA